MPNRTSIPGFLSHLPTLNGYPVPRFVGRNEDGELDFRVLDANKMLKACRLKACGICGRKLDFTSWFVTGPSGLQNRTVSDPPLHLRCARYALGTCPHMVHRRAKRRDTENVTIRGETLDVPKSKIVMNAGCRSYSHRRDKKTGRVLVRIRPVEVHAHIYEEGDTLSPEPAIIWQAGDNA